MSFEYRVQRNRGLEEQDTIDQGRRVKSIVIWIPDKMFRQFEMLDWGKGTRIAASGISRICFVNEVKAIWICQGKPCHWTETFVISFAAFIRDFASLSNLRQHVLVDGKQKFGPPIINSKRRTQVTKTETI